MDGLDRLRAVILSTIVRDIPKGFWEDGRTGSRQTYLDAYHEVAHYPALVAEQRLDKLYQDRHFRMEHLLLVLAQKHGLSVSPTILVENNRHYVYVTHGAIALTQAYVPAIGDMPKAAKFRERHAAMNNISQQARLALGDEPMEVLLGKDFYGLLIHNPVGKRFTEVEQRLGMIQFCVPYPGCTTWALQLTIEEIIAGYDIARRIGARTESATNNDSRHPRIRGAASYRSTSRPQHLRDRSRRPARRERSIYFEV
jgi:hypothetical protein